MSSVTKIESAANDTYKKFLSLTTSKGIKKESLFILSGEKLIAEFLKKPHLAIAFEVVTAKMPPLTRGKVTELSPELFKELDVVGTHYNLLVLELPVLSEANMDTDPQGLEVVLPVGDPSNLGALIRSCEAFAVSQVILTSEAANPFLPKSVKASAGSVLRMKLRKGPSVKTLPASTLALDAKGTPLPDFKWPKDARLLVGEEGPGIQGLKFEKTLSIPTRGVESLNAVVAASLALYQHQLYFRRS
jgi:TrmH family RNA methyltransferase